MRSTLKDEIAARKIQKAWKDYLHRKHFSGKKVTSPQASTGSGARKKKEMTMAEKLMMQKEEYMIGLMKKRRNANLDKRKRGADKLYYWQLRRQKRAVMRTWKVRLLLLDLTSAYVGKTFVRFKFYEEIFKYLGPTE